MRFFIVSLICIFELFSLQTSKKEYKIKLCYIDMIFIFPIEKEAYK